MASFTAQVLIERAQARADMTGTFVTEAQWLRWATVEQAWLENFILKAGYVLRESSEDISTTSTGLSYPLTTSPIAILGVYEVESNGRFRYIAPADFTLGPAGRTSSTVATGVTGPATSFRAIAQADGDIELQFYPHPGAGKTYRVFYVPEVTALTNVANTVNYPGGLEERIVL